ncbi:MAG: radical SAM protein [Deltaproteobacteria bacterium]|nr:radical SAM protein [Deltaproteobacteria bacterium]
MASSIFIDTHAIIERSRVNGPGQRLVVFFQGCHRNCPGCFNPATHSIGTGVKYGIREIFARFLSKNVSGLTVSGGEPFLQSAALCELLKTAKREHGLTTAVYTGFTIEEIRSSTELSPALEHIDVLIDGAFDENNTERTTLARGSTNQRLHFLSGVYSIDDFILPGKAEIIINKDGSVVETGFSKPAGINSILL